jgi:hypothetical protein
MPLASSRGAPLVGALPRRDRPLDRVAPLDTFVGVSAVDEGCVERIRPRVTEGVAGGPAFD